MCRSAMKSRCCIVYDTTLACALYAQDVAHNHECSCVPCIEYMMLLVLRGQYLYTPWGIGLQYNAGAEEEKVIWLFAHNHRYHDVFIQQTMELVPRVQDEEASDTMTFLLMPNGMVFSNHSKACSCVIVPIV